MTEARPSSFLDPHSHIHCLGIGGYGINPIARVMHEMGYTVSGCDVRESALIAPLRDMGIPIDIGHNPAHFDLFKPDALLISSAITSDNPEVQEAEKRGIPIFKRSDILGALTENRLGIAVAGTHGKTTTTAMIAHTLATCGLDPTFIIGGISKNLGTNARAGKGEAFVIEADEYDRMFMGLRPKIVVLTSLELDHPDMFDSIADVRALFEEFIGLLSDDGLLIGCMDDKEVARLVNRRQLAGLPAIGYGHGPESEWIIASSSPDGQGGMGYLVSFREPEEGGAFLIGSISGRLTLPGEHNVLNAVAALAVVDRLGVGLRQAADALSLFEGTGRRFEVKGEARGVTVIDDYAHHPTAIRATLEAARSRYGGRPIWAVWQPHTYRRTKALLDGFVSSFREADHVIITDVYKSRDTDNFGVSVEDVLAKMSHPDARHIAELDDVTAFLAEHVRSGDVVIVMSAGDGTRVGDELLKRLTMA